MKSSFQPRQPELPIIVTAPREVTAYLATLDLTIEELVRAVWAAQVARSEWTPDHPPTAQGTAVHDAAITELRRLLRRRKWRIVNEKNQALALHPTREIAVMVANGDRPTGHPYLDADPRTRAAKGRGTRRAVEQNQRQGTFSQVSPAFDPPKRETWILLIRIDSSTYAARAELSQPAGFDTQGHVSVWTHRLILTDSLRASDPISLSPSAQDWGYPARIDIPVRRKTEWDTSTPSTPADSPSPDRDEV